MSATVDRFFEEKITDMGFNLGTGLENRVAYRLGRYGLRPPLLRQQYQISTYRLDFAIPQLRVAIEADGWHHQSPHGAEQDARRDSQLRSLDWITFRVDDISDIAMQVSRVAQIVNLLCDHYKVGKFI